MDEADVARILGQIEGRLGGIDREIKDVKAMLQLQGSDCKTCKKGIDTRFDITEKRVSAIADIHVGEQAVQSWWDSTYTRAGLVCGIILGVVGFLRELF